jgi:hypothetical protein
MQAALLSWQNVLVVGEPGNGKTEILYHMLRQVFGPDATMLFPCVPSTLPADIIGYANPIYSIDPDAEAKGIPYWITKGTPVNDSVHACLLDEVSRFGDLGMDTAVHAMHAISKFHRPVYVGTANWLTATPRNEALRDRFSFTVWYQAAQADIRGLVAKPAISTWDFDLPDFEQVLAVNSLVTRYVESDPAAFKCSETIIALLEQIQRLCEEQGADDPFRLNNRRVFQFRAMLYAMGAYYSGSADFVDLPREAFLALKYAYPVIDYMQAVRWQKIVGALIDVVETEISEFKANAYQAWVNIVARYSDARGNIKPEGRDQLSQELGGAWQRSERLLREQFPGDPRVESALREMFSKYRELLRNGAKAKVA